MPCRQRLSQQNNGCKLKWLLNKSDLLDIGYKTDRQINIRKKDQQINTREKRDFKKYWSIDEELSL